MASDPAQDARIACKSSCESSMCDTSCFAIDAQESERKPAAKHPLEWGEPSYSICVTRMDLIGRTQKFEFDGYGLLRELLDDIEAEAEKRGWFVDTQA